MHQVPRQRRQHLKGAGTIATRPDAVRGARLPGCHLVDGYEDLPTRRARICGASPPRSIPSWLVRWVTNPHEYRPKTRMPNFMFNQDEAVAIAAYLLDASKADSDAVAGERGRRPAGVDPEQRGAGGARQGARRQPRLPRLPRLRRQASRRRCSGENKDIAPESQQHRRKDRRALDLLLAQGAARLLAGVAHAEPAVE